LVRAVIIKLTRTQEEGIREGGIGELEREMLERKMLERKGLKGVILAWAHSTFKTPC
jgi:hypothetical protein